MGKNKVARWTEMASFNNVIQPDIEDVRNKDYQLKGNWKSGYFGNDNPLVLELGCGKGEYTVGLAEKFPEKNFIGIDIKGARIWRGAKTAHENRFPNALFLRTRIEFINSFFAEEEVDEIWITFPDPFPKYRDAQKRLTSTYFLNSYRQFLRDRGIIHLKTDNEDLFRFTSDIIRYNGCEIVISTDDLYSGEIKNEILSIRTHYEKIFLTESKKIYYLSFILDKNKPIKDAYRDKKP